MSAWAALSIGSFRVSVAVPGAVEDLRGGADLGFGRALPFGEGSGEGVVVGGQVFYPRAHLRGGLPGGQGELVALGAGGGLGFGRPQRGVVLSRVTAAEFGVGGHS